MNERVYNLSVLINCIVSVQVCVVGMHALLTLNLDSKPNLSKRFMDYF